MTKHPYKLTLAVVQKAVEDDDNIGFCLACGAEQPNVEPDANNYQCSNCHQHKVYGAEEILLQGLV